MLSEMFQFRRLLQQKIIRAYGLLLIAILAVYGQSLNFTLLWWDDREHICRNPFLNPPTFAGLGELWTKAYFGLFAPVVYSVWALPMRAALWMGFDRSPCLGVQSWFHGIALCLHLANCILVFHILDRLLEGKNYWPAVFGALLFCLHPLQVETVAWVSATRDLLSAFFGFSAILLFLKGQEKFSFASLLLGFFSKASAVVFPGLLLLLLWPRRKSLKPSEKIFFAVALLASFVVAVVTKSIQPDLALTFDVPLWERPFFYLQALGFYLWKLIFPWGLGADYGRSAKTLLENPSLLTLGIPALILLSWLSTKRKKYLPMAIWFVAAIAPVSGLMNFGFEEVSTVADRYVYVAMFGVAWALAILLKNFDGKKVKIGFAAALFGLGVLSALQTTHWFDDEAFFQHSLGLNPSSAISHSNLANAYFQKDEFPQADPEFRKALALNPKDKEGWLGFARNLEKLGRVQEAEEAYMTAIQKEVALPQTFNNLGSIFFQRRNFPEAQKLWAEAARQNPMYMEPRFNLGQLLLNQGRPLEAADYFRQAIEISPLDPRPRERLDFALKQAH